MLVTVAIFNFIHRVGVGGGFHPPPNGALVTPSRRNMTSLVGGVVQTNSGELPSVQVTKLNNQGIPVQSQPPPPPYPQDGQPDSQWQQATPQPGNNVSLIQTGVHAHSEVLRSNYSVLYHVNQV